MSEMTISRRMAKLGISDFETVADVERWQKDFLRKLRSTSIERRRYAGFEDCSVTVCGRFKCAEVCRFAAYHRRQKHIAAAHHLLMQTGQPIFEVRVARGVWVRHTGELNKASIGAAKKLNRRAFDSLYRPKLVAVGAFKVAPATVFDGRDVWVAEIHELVAGAEIETIRRAFSPTARPPSDLLEHPDLTWVRKVENAGKTLNNIFDYRVRPWRNPRDTARQEGDSGKKSKWTTTNSEFGPATVTMGLWEEYYQWRLSLPANIYLIRYGCDRYYNKLEKHPRKIWLKDKKRHPYPGWLEPYWFGGPRWEQGVDLPRPRRASDSDANDINLEDDD